jgi:hypothetical protein
MMRWTSRNSCGLGVRELASCDGLRQVAVGLILTGAALGMAVVPSVAQQRESAGRGNPSVKGMPTVSPDPPQAPRDVRDIVAGGLIFVPDPEVVLERRDVLIRDTAIRAAYTLRNDAAEPRRFLVTFALPPLDLAAIGEQQVILPSLDPANYVNAVVTADGQRVALDVEVRAVAYGLDVSSQLIAAGLPLFPFTQGLALRLSRLDDMQKALLVERGILRVEDGETFVNWTYTVTASWLQSIPAQHSLSLTLDYQPVSGAGGYSPEIADKLQKTYCLEAPVADLLRRKNQAGVNVSLRWVSYGLSNDASSSEPANTFRLVVEKPDAETAMATCWPALRALGPTAFEWTASQTSTEDDFSVLFIK